MLQFVECPPHIAEELSDKLTFEVPGAKYMPSVKRGHWDGMIRLFNRKNGRINAGLLQKVKQIVEDSGAKLEFEDSEFGLPGSKNAIKRADVVEWTKGLTLPFEPKYYQYDALAHGMKNKRAVFLSPTGSGKSFIAYLLCRAFLEKNQRHVLIIVPTTGLVEQLHNDFVEYNPKMSGYIQKIYAGHETEIKMPITISTWQSIYKFRQPWFEKFGMVIGDEAHGFKSTSLTSIMNKSINADYRFGLSGTLDDSEVHALVLEGLFGPIVQVTTTNKLQKEKTLAHLDIKIAKIKYSDAEKKHTHKMTYHEEVDFIVTHEKRNKLIKKLALSLEGNTLVLFNYVEKHGKVLRDMLEEDIEEGRKLYYVSGETAVNDRESIRGIVEKQGNAIIVASFGTFSTGINIRNIHNIIFASPSKSVIRVLQSIGRGLRVSDDGMHTTLFDLMDDLIWTGRENFAYKHAVSRTEIYEREKFPFAIEEVRI